MTRARPIPADEGVGRRWRILVDLPGREERLSLANIGEKRKR